MVVTKKSHDVKKNPHTTAEKSLVYLHYYYFFCVGDLKLSQEQKHNPHLLAFPFLGIYDKTFGASIHMPAPLFPLICQLNYGKSQT